MAHRFIVGETPQEATKVLQELWRTGAASSVDLLGEATVTTAEADRYAQRCAQALDELAGVYEGLPERRQLERDGLGALPRANLSVKVSALTPLLRPDAPEIGKRDAAPRLRELLRRASSAARTCTSTWSPSTRARRSPTSCWSCSPSTSSRDGPSAGLVLQAYLRDSPGAVRPHHGVGRATPAARSPLTVRLVKGAYWDHEIVEARQHGWDAPVFEVKADSDRNFEDLTVRLLEARPFVRPAIASHNLRSVAHAVAQNRAPRRAPTRTSSCRCCAASATTCSTRSPRWGCACAPTARSATSSPAWPTSSAGCSRTRATSPSCTSRPAASPLETLLAAP